MAFCSTVAGTSAKVVNRVTTAKWGGYRAKESLAAPGASAVCFFAPFWSSDVLESGCRAVTLNPCGSPSLRGRASPAVDAERRGEDLDGVVVRSAYGPRCLVDQV